MLKLKVENRTSLGIDHIFQLQPKCKCKIYPKPKPHSNKSDVYKEQAHICSSHTQLIGKTGCNMEAMMLKKVPYVSYYRHFNSDFRSLFKSSTFRINNNYFLSISKPKAHCIQRLWVQYSFFSCNSDCVS